VSTKATVAFAAHDGEVMAAVYLHHGGGITPAFFAQFFEDVARACPSARDCRFFDPSYLAAKFVTWSMAGTVAVGGTGVIASPERWHAHRRFTVRCHREPSAVPPEVTEGAGPAAPELPDAPNAQFVGGNGYGQVIVTMPRPVMTREEALAHAAWLAAIADPGGEEFPRYLAAVRST
jgi:hypothetical protein